MIAAWMPWLYLVLRRAPVATLTAALVAVLFFVVPQSREVLSGLGEPPLRSFKDLDASNGQLINFVGFYSYLASAILLALATWYSARLLVTVESERAMLPALASPDARDRLGHAAIWLPRALGVFVLAAATGALIYAGCTPRLTQGKALGLVLLAVVGPLVLVAGAMRGKRVAQVIGALAFATAAVLLFVLLKPVLAAHDVCAAALPAGLLALLVWRRRWLETRAVPAAAIPQKPFAGIRKDSAGLHRSFDDAFRMLCNVLAVGFALMLVLAWLGAAPARALGSATAVLVFLAAAGLMFTAVHIGLRHMADNVPGLSTALVLLMALSIAFVGQESLGSEKLDSNGASATGAAIAPAAPAVSAQRPARPLYVNAHGGGLRAASFTAQVLARADDASCGRFGPQVAAFSGVSGGSLGIATYLLARQSHVANGGWDANCVPGRNDKTPLTDIVVRTLVQDHLSPAVARMLAVDAPHLYLWYGPRRGQALLDSWQDALLDAQPNASTKETPPRVGFELPLGALTGGLSPAPVVFFNTTDADSGNIRWMSNLDGGRVGSVVGGVGQPSGELSVGQAVLHSARFPIVSPAGQLNIGDAAHPNRRRVVDGGYADNSGATTLLTALADTDGSARLINLNGNPREADADTPLDSKPPVLTAVWALLQARTAHAYLAVQQFARRLGADRVINLTLDLDKALFDPAKGDPDEQLRRARQPPLGWYMSYGAAQTMALSVADSAKRLCDSLGSECQVRPPAQAASAVRAPAATSASASSGAAAR
jgi:hypothetical protein